MHIRVYNDSASGMLLHRRKFVVEIISTDISGENYEKDIHPSYGESIVRCACGETFKSGSVKGELKVEICSKCHPFYTGRQKLVDSGGRVDKFKKRYGMK